MEKPFNFVFIGRSGSGKGVQSDLLMKKFLYLKHIVTGEMFRNLSSRDTDTAHRINQTLKRGGLPFDDLATMLWMHEIAFTIKEKDGILLDGAPRRVVEAENLERFLDFLERGENTFIIFLDTTREEAEK
ncbi:MAG: nucleoside monophosphate kinase, partial [Planctomycetes bacterium]|nr:nucleoside monophosphate kinase [Planctomycetota bacterium]